MQIDIFGNKSILEQCKELFKQLENESIQTKVELINDIREELHKYSPFNTEPVDFVRWIKNDLVQANDYNPNSVAPPEMKLLEHSISEDGYTQPIVSWSRDGIFEVVDGFHRHRVGKESGVVCSRVHGYLPAVVINGSRQNKNDRMASTIRHNRARGEHKVESMSEIVVELKRRFWSDEKIAKELGMEADEVLRLQQVTGLSGLFADSEFSEAWEAETFEEVEGVDELSE
jgi:ParB-like chromosome segregation protein Spo0J